MGSVVTQIRVTLWAVATSAGLLGATPAAAQPDEPEEVEFPEPSVAEPPEEEAPDTPEELPAVEGEGGERRPTAEEIAATPLEPPPPREHEGRFAFGSYGRAVAATDHQGRAPRSANIVAYGSRLDLDNYGEIELRREDYFRDVGAHTRIVATMAFGHPIFHYDGEFDARIALRNLFVEERGLGLEELGVWAGSRMYRGDDIYPLNWWPLDNLNTIGGGVTYDNPETWTFVRAHFGIGQPHNPFYRQDASRPLPFNQFGEATVALLDRQRFVGSLRAEQHARFGESAGIKFIAYGEVHHAPGGQRELEREGQFEDVPRENGWVLGGQVGAYTGERDTHINLFVRYANGLAAYGEHAHPSGLGPDDSTAGAHEVLVAAGGNLEVGPATFLLGAYFRTFRNASEALDFGDLDEGIVLVRPHLFVVDWAGLAVEASYQAQQRGVLADIGVGDFGTVEPQPVVAHVGRFGVMPFLSPAGRGTFKRPIIYFAYVATFRDQAARALYPVDDVFNLREVDHYVGIGAEWWFSSTSYGRGE
jgi:hypothetical protein